MATALLPAAPAMAADTFNTDITADVYSGTLDISAPASLNFGYVVAGTPVSQAFGTPVTVTDNQVGGAGSWTAQVSSTAFSGPGGTVTVTYSGGTCTPTKNSTGPNTPACSTTTPAFTLTTTPHNAATGTGFDTLDTGSWTPTLSFTAPTTVGHYSATVTHSVS